MSGHTPGPWSLSKTDRYFYVRGAGGEYIQQYMVGAQKKSVNEVREANARLIASAPELLEALIKCRDELAGLPHSLGYDFTHLPALDALIRKATQP